MPPKIRGSLSKSLSRAGDTTATDFYCPSCAIHRRSLPTRRIRTQGAATTARLSSTWTPPSTAAAAPRPVTASSVVHGARHVPPRLRELYGGLSKLNDVAPEQVNISRLQLALRGLETETPLIRVAVLGLNDAVAARKLVRLLLADPLGEREGWEDVLDATDGDLTQGLLIRYGDTFESIPNNLLPTITVPSPILKRGNLEILVSTVGAETKSAHSQFSADTFLVPTVTIQTSHSGQHNFVRYPVHRTIVCGSGMDGLLAYSGLLARSDLQSEAESVYGAIELPINASQKHSDRVAFVDVDQASDALAKFRESVQNATLYERGWNSSGVQPVVDWVSALRTQTGHLDPSLRTLITALLDAAEAGVAAKELRNAQELEAESVSDAVRASMGRELTTWAERGHSELRSALEEGFASKRWRGLAWWKLFWRVDDVGMITSEILERKYLRRAEKEVIWTAGKFQQAGLDNLPEMPQPSEEQILATSDAAATDPPTTTPEISPWPTQITRSRTRLLETTVPSLQALAQRLVLFSMSTTTLASALSALAYLSIPTASFYESGSIAAVGLAYSLRRQQKQWGAAREFWEDEVREEGRTALLATEEHLGTVVREGGRREGEVSEREARETLSRTRKALEGVQ
ncbi:uncharacterized protein BDW47DRAFT_133272 [Aspergillus candidus]|uniref:Mmc1 C-terminal domain-containing protein n=1 Tax=Aspergillus candidus TaxID=41067 RepID=A0A2I2F5D2_ASPCN|nr:hypothetical protein BDW47DRAFT_133272 [Aspergillus candidus]PLB35776.1 hypothetical protein BDW47DRAFT_133272 [Aspergillus candidus]